MFTHVYSSPCGPLILGDYRGSLCFCDWMTSKASNRRILLAKRLNTPIEEFSTPLLKEAVTQLDEYFNGKRRTFDLPLFESGTPFRNEVRRALLTIPYGHTATYGQIAELIGRPKAVRAVAGAIATNPLSIIIPCHRVIGSDGSLTGYAGTLPVKEYLLALETSS